MFCKQSVQVISEHTWDVFTVERDVNLMNAAIRRVEADRVAARRQRAQLVRYRTSDRIGDRAGQVALAGIGYIHWKEIVCICCVWFTKLLA